MKDNRHIKPSVGIITTHHYPNYGNKLQNYALQTTLIRLGYNVETISDARFYPDMRSLWANRKALLHYIIRFRTKPVHIKITKFIFWSKRYIKYAPITVHNDDDIEKIKNRYDFFVVGSDQIWNPEWPNFSNSFGFASFARKDQKIAYAPSLGIDKMIPGRAEEYKSYLAEWKALSCREYEGAEIIRNLTNIPVEVVVDPTILLSAEDWDKIAKKPKQKKPYALFYVIGEISDYYRTYALEIANKKGLTLMDTGGAPEREKGLSPGEFVGLIKNSKLVITDSFHGSVFSLIYHIPLVVLKRTVQGKKNQLSRIRTLFSHANIVPRDFLMTVNDNDSLKI